MKCKTCGAEMVDAFPIDIYCPTAGCRESEIKASVRRVRESFERTERAHLRALMAKYPDEVKNETTH